MSGNKPMRSRNREAAFVAVTAVVCLIACTGLCLYFANKARQSAKEESVQQQRADRESAAARRANHIAAEQIEIARKQTEFAAQQSKITAAQTEIANAKVREAAESEQRASRLSEQLITNTGLAGRVDQYQYAARMNLAQAAWNQTQISETIRLLGLYDPAIGNQRGDADCRGFEWYYWNRLVHSCQNSFPARTPVNAVFSPDGTRLAIAGRNGVTVWNMGTSEVLHRLGNEDALTETVAFSPDGLSLASAGEDGIRIWDARPWTPELKAEDEAIRLIRFHRAGPLAEDKLTNSAICNLISCQPANRLSKSKLRAAITADLTISELVRQRALEMVRD